MSLADILINAYGWLDDRAAWVALACCAFPLVGTGAAWIGRGGRTDADGKVIASVVIGISAITLIAQLAAILIARVAFDASVLNANILLLIGPVICLGGSLYGIHLVFPLNQLASVRSLGDIALFCLGCGAVLWLVTQFRGWGIIFHGGLIELAAIGALSFFLLHRLFRRAFGARR